MREVLGHYWVSLRTIVPLFFIHVTLRILMAGLIVPSIALALSVVLYITDKAVLTDLDIVRFLLSPWGIAGGLLVISLMLAVSVLEVGIMTYTLRVKGVRPVIALLQGTSFFLHSFHRIVVFAAVFVARVLLTALPFLAVAGLVTWVAMTEHDINYYLTVRPATFLLSVAMILFLALAMVIVLMFRLSGWAIALHLLLLRGRSPNFALAESSQQLTGRRTLIVKQIAVWAVIRYGLSAALLVLLAHVLRFLLDTMGDNLRLMAAVVALVLGAWSLLLAIISACSNGALASLFITEYERIMGTSAITEQEQAGVTGFAIPVLILIATVAVVIGGLRGERLLDRLAKDRTVEIIAHRGAAADRPENSIAAIEKAIEDRADWIEIDVQENADGEIVIAHDSDFMKQARVATKIWQATAADIARIDIGTWYDPEYAAERTPYLRDVLAATKGRTKLLIELKYYGHDEDLERRVAELVDNTGMTQEIAVMSLKIPGVEKMRSLRPEWRSGVLAATAVGDLTRIPTDFLAVNAGQVSMQLINRAERANKDVYVWTVDDPATMVRLISMGIDGLITNNPALARKVMEQRNELSTPERLLLWLADAFGVGKYTLTAPEVDA